MKEYYFYLDSTPTHSYMKYLYKYPQAAFPYEDLVETSRRRSRQDLEYELIETGVFRDDRYFDVFVEYAKTEPELGARGVTALAWESFGEGWVTDAVKQLKLEPTVMRADYGQLPDLDKVDWADDVLFTWNGTTSGVRVQDGDSQGERIIGVANGMNHIPRALRFDEKTAQS
mgnify:CR=1 FL=1